MGEGLPEAVSRGLGTDGGAGSTMPVILAPSTSQNADYQTV